MNLHLACSNILAQLTNLVDQIHEGDFSKPVESLSRSTIGQHLRHTLEFFLCFQQGYHNGVINYDKRAHDKLIESDKFIALAAIGKVTTFIQQLEDKPLRLEASYDPHQDNFITIQTNAARELVYNIEHAVHHMAIIKIGVREIAPYITLPKDFGVAASTIRHQETIHSTH
jgi:uncharacterized damage-inducible protein DinB